MDTFRVPKPTFPDYGEMEKVPQLFLAAKNARRAQDRADRHAEVQESYSRLKEARDAELHRIAVEKEARQQRLDTAKAASDVYQAAQSGQTGRAGLMAAAAGIGLKTERPPIPGQLEPAPAAPQFPEGAFEIPQEGSRGPAGQSLNPDIFGATNGTYEQHAKRSLAGKPAPALASQYAVAGQHRGMTEPGNIDLTNRPDVVNPDGTHSSVRSISVNVDGSEVLIPTVSEDGRVMSDREAVQQYMRTGRHLGKFRTPEEATAYASALHEQQAGSSPQQRIYQPQQESNFPDSDQVGKREALREFGNATNAHLDAMDARPAREAQRAAEIKAAQEAPAQVSLTLPGQDQPITFDQNEQEAYRRFQMTQQADQLISTASNPNIAISPDVRQMMLTQGLAMKAGLNKDQAAPVTGAQAQVQKQTGNMELQGAKDKASMARLDKTLAAKLKKAAAGAGKLTDKALKLKLQIGREYDAIVKEVLNQFNFKSGNLSNRKYNELAAKLAADPNAALDTAISGEFVKLAQGGTGVVSDADYRVFWQKIGSVGDQTVGWVSRALTGEMGDQKRRVVASAVHDLAIGVQDSLNTAVDAVEKRLSVEPGGKERANNYSDVYRPGAATPQSAAAGSAARKRYEDMSDEELAAAKAKRQK